ncbi:MAG: zf-HC2 domain-containing protein [Elusimicrobia bacterium]|nr:zf-HC2 domain-containing protein [Elusimicrobiota bacterium]
MNCGRATELVWAFLDDETSESDRAALQDHLTGCVRCAGYLSEARRLHQALVEAAGDAPAPSLEGAVLARLEGPEQSLAPARMLDAAWPAAAFLLFVGAAACAAGWDACMTWVSSLLPGSRDFAPGLGYWVGQSALLLAGWGGLQGMVPALSPAVALGTTAAAAAVWMGALRALLGGEEHGE